MRIPDHPLTRMSGMTPLAALILWPHSSRQHSRASGYRANSSRSALSSSRAASALIGSPKTKPCAYSQPSW